MEKTLRRGNVSRVSRFKSSSFRPSKSIVWSGDERILPLVFTAEGKGVVVISEEQLQKSYRKYLKFLKGKRIALVGPAGYLVAQNKGQEIDNHDLVVRLNNSFPLSPDAFLDTGSRTDILYHTCGRIKKILKKIGTDGIGVLENDGIRWLVAKHHPFRGSFKNKAKTQRFISASAGRIETVCAPPRLLSSLQGKLKGTDPNMGTLAITHLLTTGIRELSIYGIDFRASGYHPGYTLPPGYGWNEKRTRIIKSDGSKKSRGPHDKQRQIAYLRRMFGQDNRVKIDKHLQAVLEGRCIT